MSEFNFKEMIGNLKNELDTYDDKTFGRFRE